jgi:hypothetical protein
MPTSGGILSPRFPQLSTLGAKWPNLFSYLFLILCNRGSGDGVHKVSSKQDDFNDNECIIVLFGQ